MNTSAENHDRLDEATAARLAKLAAMPVDTSRLDARLRAKLPPPPLITPRSRRLWLRPLQTAAAAFVLVATILALMIATSARPALASVETLARMHDEVASGRAPTVKVSSIQAAAAVLTQQWPNAPSLPDMPDDHVMACCVHDIGRTKLAVVALEIDGTPLTLAVADASEIKSPQGDAVQRDGITYRIQSSAGVNMAMTQRSGRWICLMGRVPLGRLVEVLSQSSKLETRN